MHVVKICSDKKHTFEPINRFCQTYFMLLGNIPSHYSVTMKIYLYYIIEFHLNAYRCGFLVK